ncbi:major capsid protein [Pararoseomonas sp. SCSIO 73927]|uniref:major capsid protein n=1 Tax=Pararoseomonas sp. SCSIO 73927 TaxID=3114537 RepID=UPI0030D1D76B
MSGTMMDIFNGDAFTSVTLTSKVNETFPYVPTFLYDLGIAPAEGMVTLTAAFEEETGGIRLIPTSPRGAPPSQQTGTKAKLRKLDAVHFAREAHVNADELLALRGRGALTPETAQGLLLKRTDGPVGLKVEWKLTLEHMLLGAVDGVVYDADNSTVLYDYFDWMGTTRPDALNLPISTMTADTAVFEAFAMALRREMILALTGMAFAGGQVVVLCGDNFFDALITSKELKAAKKNGAMGNQDAALKIADNSPYSAFIYAGIVWVNYRGTLDTKVSVPTDEARAFMLGVPGLFQTLFAPADTFDTVGAEGLPLYLLNLPERQTSKRFTAELQSNPLIACLRPRSLRRITKS